LEVALPVSAKLKGRVQLPGLCRAAITVCMHCPLTLPLHKARSKLRSYDF